MEMHIPVILRKEADTQESWLFDWHDFDSRNSTLWNHDKDEAWGQEEIQELQLQAAWDWQTPEAKGKGSNAAEVGGCGAVGLGRASPAPHQRLQPVLPSFFFFL